MIFNDSFFSFLFFFKKAVSCLLYTEVRRKENVIEPSLKDSIAFRD